PIAFVIPTEVEESSVIIILDSSTSVGMTKNRRNDKSKNKT
ncbi:MAG: hypothetical protein ACI9LN_002395, partial [Saprospiraceae bacterium]